MGSGLILLVIVGAWLAVLVPMALKSHDQSTALKSADRFSDAMRSLGRRGAGDQRDVLVPRRPATRVDPQTPRLTMAERRRRTLLVLVGLTLLTFGLALLGTIWLVAANVTCDLLLVAFVVHLRRQAILKAERSRPVERVPVAGPSYVPSRMPRRPAPLSAPLPTPAARYEDKPLPVAATGTDGDNSWSPVPVPPPTYVGKPAAPYRAPRVVDLTKPGRWSEAMDGEDAGLDILDEGPELDDILDRRRAANGW